MIRAKRLRLIDDIGFGTRTMTFHVHGVPNANPRFEANDVLRHTLRWIASVDGINCCISCSEGKLVDGNVLQHNHKMISHE